MQRFYGEMSLDFLYKLCYTIDVRGEVFASLPAP